jgi:vitamin K-dependent gamma-carboxylase
MTDAHRERAARASWFCSHADPRASTFWSCSRLGAPLDVASLAVFRVLFGGLLALSAVRFVSYGWVGRFFGERTFFFKYWGFAWLAPLSAQGMLLVYAAIALLSLLVAVGLFYRVAIVALFLLFSYAELTDVTNYLNHYYLVSLIAFLLCFMPLSCAYSLDAKWGRVEQRQALPAFMLWLLRFQVCVVYFFAAKAKWGEDWLVRGQPLQSWLLAQVDVPVIGAFLVKRGAALALSWAGMLHDLCVPGLLMWRRTRWLAYAALLLFHALTGQWFNIGIFPLLMPLLATLFFDAGWPRRLCGTARAPLAMPTAERLNTPAFAAIALYCLLQLLVPLRSHLYGGNVLWHEQGMRFAWKVLVRAKHGSVRFRVALPDGREISVSPRTYLTLEQEREMAGQPDLILQLAHHVGADFRARGHAQVQVHADAWVALNGRAPRRMIDPEVDLLQREDGLGKADWVTAAPP